MKKTTFLWCLLLVMAGTVFANNPYRYRVDLNQVQDDRVMVELKTPKVERDLIEFQMPKVVPGTYSISDFGRFIHDFKAYDASGEELVVIHGDDPNRWQIQGASSLDKITYWVEDTWDSDQPSPIFEPGGTNIEAGTNFVINTFGFFGYLEGMKEMPFEVEILKPEGFYGSTALIAEESDASKDLFRVDGYNLLADSPMMYCVPDTAVKMVGGAQVLISVYSPNDRTHASAIMDAIAEVLDAQRRYLGGTLPVKKYAFICYLTGGMGGASGGMGALEHSYSSLYFMPEVDDEQAGDMMRDVAAHEFFHIVTPLNVHSEQIHYFDFIDPKMSRHLWLYEGVTEYSAHHVQVYYGLISRSQYLQTLQSKIGMAAFFIDDVPFTEISAGCLDEYKAQYANVYQKGALIGAALDIRLRALSNGEMGLQDVMRRLEKKFGKDQPFEDEKLFEEIIAVSHPGLKEFFDRYVDGPNPLPYKEIFRQVGVTYEADVDREILSMGRVGFGFNDETERFYIANARRMNKFGKDMGYEEGDELVIFDGEKVTADNFDALVAKFREEHKEGDKLVVEVARPDGNGGYKTKKLKGKTIAVRQKVAHLLEIDPNATPEQEKLRDAWLGAQ